MLCFHERGPLLNGDPKPHSNLICFTRIPILGSEWVGRKLPAPTWRLRTWPRNRPPWPYLQLPQSHLCHHVPRQHHQPTLGDTREGCVYYASTPLETEWLVQPTDKDKTVSCSNYVNKTEDYTKEVELEKLEMDGLKTIMTIYNMNKGMSTRIFQFHNNNCNWEAI